MSNVLSIIIGKSMKPSSLSGASYGLQSIFGNPNNDGQTFFAKSSTDLVISVQDKSTKIAVQRQRGAVNSSSLNSIQPYTSYNVSTGVIEVRTTISSNNINKPTIEENPFQPWTKQQRTLYHIGNEAKNQIKMIVNAMETMASESICLGTNSASKIDFGRKADLIATPSNLWGTASGTPLNDIDNMVLKCDTYGSYNIDMAVFGSQAIAGFIGNKQVIDNASTRSINLVGIGNIMSVMPPQFERFTNAGFQYMGKMFTLTGNVIHIFTYTKTYQNASNQLVSYINPKSVLLMSSQMPCDRYFTATDMLENDASRRYTSEVLGISDADVNYNLPNSNFAEVIMPEMFDFKFAEQDESYVLKCQSAPIFVPRDPNSTALLTGVVS